MTVGKHGADRCEDVIVVADHHIAVIDGATDKSGITYRFADQDVTSGRFAASVVASGFEALEPDVSANDAFRFLTGTLDEAVRAQQPYIGDTDRPCVSLVAYSHERREIWSLGDARFRLDQDGVTTLSAPTRAGDVAAAALRSAILATYAAAGQNVPAIDPGRAAVAGFLARQGLLAHTSGEFGFGVLDGRPPLDEHICIAALADGPARVVLASDGYPEIHRTFDESEASLAALLASDPMCVGPLRGTKGVDAAAVSFDDRAWVSFSVGPR